MIDQYLYISTAPGLSNDEVEAIAQSSVRNNASRGVTGLLLYNGRNFLQLLEGEKAALDELMTRIKCDPRHDGFSILYRGTSDVRACPEWGMKWVRIVDSTRIRRDALESELPSNLKAELRTMILNFATLN